MADPETALLLARIQFAFTMIWQAAAPYESQLFMLIGSLVLIPTILGYTIWSYWVFRGKVGDEGYHEH